MVISMMFSNEFMVFLPDASTFIFTFFNSIFIKV